MMPTLDKKPTAFTDRYQWCENPEINAYLFKSGVARLAGQAMQSNQVLYFDHLLVKEPETTAPTPWHQDVPYWPFMGKHVRYGWH
ncbi:MAG: phytanoyl-CoA dioxygenase family protein [Pseudomonadales bacterium]